MAILLETPLPKLAAFYAIQNLKSLNEHALKKRIWVFHHYADPPDGHWTGTYDLQRILAQRGHDITIYSSSFSHYSRTDSRVDGHQTYTSRIYGGVKFIFVKTASYRTNGLRRVANMVGYSVRAARHALSQPECPDVVIGASPHPLCALSGLKVARSKGARFLFEVHDLWPLFLIELGKLRAAGLLSRGLRWAERALLERADQVLPLWPRMHRYFAEHGIPKTKCTWLPLGVDFDAVQVAKPREPGVGEPFTVMYRGRFGHTNDVTTVIHSAKVLQDRRQNQIRFVVVGEGPERESLENLRSSHGLQNLVFEAFGPHSSIHQDMGRADVLVGSLPSLPHFAKYGMISTKLVEYLSSNRPVIFATDIQNHLVAQAGAGIVVPPGNPAALSDAIEELQRMPREARRQMAENGLRYARENHDLRRIAERLESVL